MSNFAPVCHKITGKELKRSAISWHTFSNLIKKGQHGHWARDMPTGKEGKDDEASQLVWNSDKHQYIAAKRLLESSN